MKKLICLVLPAVMLFCSVGCGSDDIGSANTSSNITSSKVESIDKNSSTSSDVTDESSDDSTSSKEEATVDDWRTHPEDFKLIALTYDDAPSFSDTNGNSTVRIIDAINKYDGRGTLFVVGRTLQKNGKALLEYAAQKGFEMGNHTYSHQSVSTSEVGKSWTAVENFDDFNRCQELIVSETGQTPKFLRPAGVHTNEELYLAASSLGLPCVSGNCKRAVSDYSSSTSADMIVERVLANAFDGAIILLHGNNARTAEATERLCEILYNDGYRFCTVSELFELHGIDYNDLPFNCMLYGVDPETGEVITGKKY